MESSFSMDIYVTFSIGAFLGSVLFWVFNPNKKKLNKLKKEAKNWEEKYNRFENSFQEASRENRVLKKRHQTSMYELIVDTNTLMFFYCKEIENKKEDDLKLEMFSSLFNFFAIEKRTALCALEEFKEVSAFLEHKKKEISDINDSSIFNLKQANAMVILESFVNQIIIQYDS